MSNHRFSIATVLAAAGLLAAAACSERPAGDGSSGDGGSSNSGGGNNNGGSGNGSNGGNTNGGSTNNGGSDGSTMGSGGSVGTGGIMVGQNDPTCSAYDAPRANFLSPVDPDVEAVLGQMSQDQTLSMLNGGTDQCPNWNCDFDGTGVPDTKPPVPPFRMGDGPRGVHVLSGGKSTTWAIAEARAAAFDTDLEYRVGKAQGDEMKALQLDLSLAPTVNTLRHPRWARAQETYGEDPVLVGEMGAAFVNGMQDAGVPACPKHFAANDTDDNRHDVIVTMDEQTLRENYTLPFQIIVEKSDPACIMAAYNGLNNEWCTESQHLLTDILRTDWHWTGFSLSDWWATKGNAEASMNAGLDYEMPDNRAFEQLPSLLSSGKVTSTRIHEAATRILNARVKFKQLTVKYPANQSIVDDATHIALARETEEKGAVLLKNDNILPLGPNATELGLGSGTAKSIIVLGPDSDLPVAPTSVDDKTITGLGDRGSSNTMPPHAVSLFKGLTDHAPGGITITKSKNAADASKADIVIIPVAMAHEDEGEAYDGGADRVDLTLSGTHPRHWGATKASKFINDVAKINPNVIVLLSVGGAVVMEDWMNSAKAIVQTFYPGQEGGDAVAELLFGEINFSGKLPFTVAQKESDYPAFENKGATAKVEYLHGYRRIQAPRFWFGFGASYTTYEYSDLKILCTDGIKDTGRLNVEVTVKNTGKMVGTEVVQLYIGYPHTTARRPQKELKSFTRVTLKPGESKPVQLAVPAKDMAYWGANGWVVEKVAHDVLVGPSADDTKLLKTSFTIN